MPIYEYRCQACGAQFEKLVRSSATPLVVQCPQCGSQDCKKALSLFGMSGGAAASGGANCAPSG